MHRVLGVLKSFVQKWIHHGSEQLPGAWICTEKKTLCFSSTKWPTLKTKHKSTAVEHLRFGVFEIFPHVFTNQRVWIKKQILPEATRWDFTKFDKQVCLFSMIKKKLIMVQSANFHPKIVGSKFPWIFWPARKVGYHNFICLADRLQSSFFFGYPDHWRPWVSLICSQHGLVVHAPSLSRGRKKRSRKRFFRRPMTKKKRFSRDQCYILSGISKNLRKCWRWKLKSKKSLRKNCRSLLILGCE